MTEIEQYMERYPLDPIGRRIKWDEPVKVSREGDPADKRYACRICIAKQGMHEIDVLVLPTDPEEVKRHIADAHG